MQDLTYIIGHKNPDTDTIASAMAYAALKNALGEPAIACRLGTLNEETKYATRFFDIEAPNLIKDARCQLRDIAMDKPICIEEGISCNDAFKKIVQTRNKTLYVCQNRKLLGIVSIGDLSSLHLRPLKQIKEDLKHTNLSLLKNDVEGELLHDVLDFKCNGDIHIISSNLEYFKGRIKDSICIVGNDIQLQSHLIKDEPACLILCEDSILDVSLMDEAIRHHVAIIVTNKSIMEVASNIYEAVPVSLIMTKDIHYYFEDEYVDDVTLKIINTRYRSYPVLDISGNLIGSISRFHLFKHPRKKFILVDHSSINQTIDHIKEAEILEIIDHHHIGNIETNKPIYYRNQRCGCTCTIIYEIYKENEIKPNKDIAGMMLSAIISDTLYFKSETTTKKDIATAKELALIAEVDLDAYAKDLLNASVNLKEADVLDLIRRDLKQYDFDRYRVAVGQTNYNNIEDIQSRLNEFKEVMQFEQERKEYDLLVMMFTHVLADGTMFLFYGPKSNVMFEIIQSRFDDHSGYDHSIMSRKQQLIPILSEVIKDY